MAVTKMHPIRRTVGKAVDYITDKDKTDGEIYVSTYGCTRETVEDDFDYTRHKASYNGAILAQHIIQSFCLIIPSICRIGANLPEKQNRCISERHSLL